MFEGLNPLERELYAENIKWFAAELASVAEIGEFGQLVLSQQRIDQLHEEVFPSLLAEERQIEAHNSYLSLLKSGIDAALISPIDIWQLGVFQEQGGKE